MNRRELEKVLMVVAVALMAIIAYLVLVNGAECEARADGTPEGIAASAAPTSQWCELDGWCPPPHVPGPATAEVDFPRAEHLRLIGRLAEGIYKVRTMGGKVPYWYCGMPHRGTLARDLAMTVAWHTVRAAHLASDERRELNVWGWAGTLSNEGGFDICSLGTNPRRLAYRLGVLTPRRLTLSHTKDDVRRAITDPRMESRCRTYDLGMAQTLDTHYRRWLRRNHQQGDKTDLLEWKGFYWQATYMHSLAVLHETDRPWMYWPGYRAPWKDKRVTRHARLLGATKEEI